MNETQGKLRTQTLMQRGFKSIGHWTITDAGFLSLNGAMPKGAGVYAFGIDDIIQYVGVASVGLSKRLYSYCKPGPTQRTNLRLNDLIRDALTKGHGVEVFVATPPDRDWNGWVISGPAGLEAGIIERYRLPWNIRGARPILEAMESSQSPPSDPTNQQPREDELMASPAPHLMASSAKSRDKYRPLRQHLACCKQDKVSMTFAEIQELVGPLPKSASLHRAWWANHEGNTQAKGWMPASYLAEPNPPHRSVVFRRFTP